MSDLGIFNELLPMHLEEVVFPDPFLIREKIERFEKAITALSNLHLQLKTTHRFSKGLYAREIFIPKGTVLIGKIHRHSDITICNSGHITILTENGAKRIKPPFTSISAVGIKRVGFAHEDTVWTNIHATNERDLDRLEEELYAKDYDELDSTNNSDFLTLVTMEGLCPE